MLEAELFFIDNLDVLLSILESSLKFTIHSVLTRCQESLFYLTQLKPSLLKNLQNTLESEFMRVTYSEAIQICRKSDFSFKKPPEWETGLDAEHESFLTNHFQNPLFITNYPKSIKPFYMRQDENLHQSANPSKETVSNVDLLLPGVAEVAGGSLREERFDVLLERILQSGITDTQAYDFYCDLRKYGSAPHGG
eukprot:Sdes_comp10863_c1_seq1m2517